MMKVKRLKSTELKRVWKLHVLTSEHFNFLTIKNDILGRWIQNRTAADSFAERFAEMTQARVPDFCGRFGDVVAASAQKSCRAFHPEIAQILRNSQTDFAGKNPA
jgi:hypothetical protein